MKQLDVTLEQITLIDSVRTLARERFAPRTDRYDRTARFPAEDFDDLFHAGVHAAAVPREYGGLGLGPFRGDVFTLWMITKELAKADLSLARCWEGHVNSLVLLDGMADDRQKARWFEGVVRRGEKWVAWSGEPPARAPGGTNAYGTHVQKVSGGYVVHGTKVFCTSAGAADWAILLVSTAGPGGARHTDGPPESVLLLACDLRDSTVTVDGSWWDPIGMRATVSHLVRFDKTYLPDDHVIGFPGQYLEEAWQACFSPHYAASFLGAAEAAYDFTVESLTAHGKGTDPYVQQHVGQMAIDVETGMLWLRHVARLWEAGDYEEAKKAGSLARHLVEHLALDTVNRSIRACGARSLNRPSPLERIYRDLSFYVRHDNADHLLAMIGKSVLGQPHDPSFFRP
jgi:alkylation response protein AidB-like acyl-CoA dehydrogenase